MNTIKEYKKILIIELKDWTTLRTEKTINQFMEYYEQCWDLLLVDWVIFNRFEFKKAFEEKIDCVENYIMSLEKDIRKKVETREKEKKEKIWKWFKNISEVENYIKKIVN
jgi:hypothetical protein